MEDLKKCTSHEGFDYFDGSEVAYIMAFTSLGLFPFGIHTFLSKLLWFLSAFRCFLTNNVITIIGPNEISPLEHFSVCILAAYLLYKLKKVVNYFTELKPEVSATESIRVNMSDSGDITVGGYQYNSAQNYFPKIMK